MDIRRIAKSTATNNASNNASTANKLRTVESRNSGAVQLPRFSMISDADQTFAHNTATTVELAFAEFDSHGVWNYSSPNKALFDAETAGDWYFSLLTSWTANTTGGRYVECVLNDTTALPQSVNRVMASSTTGAGLATVQTNFLLSVNAGDYIVPRATQFSGGNLNMTYAVFQGFRIGV